MVDQSILRATTEPGALRALREPARQRRGLAPERRRGAILDHRNHQQVGANGRPAPHHPNRHYTLVAHRNVFFAR